MTNITDTLQDPKIKIEEPDSANQEVIDTPEKVPDSNDERIDQDFPGFPNEPSTPEKIKIEDPESEDVEDIARMEKADQKPGNEAEITDADLAILGDKNQDMDMGEDETIPEELQRTGDDLDVPGSELDDDNEAIGEEDEENNYYSIADNK